MMFGERFGAATFAAVLAVGLVLVAIPDVLLAQEIDCLDDRLAVCGFGTKERQILPVRPVFNFQARVAQGGFLVDDHVYDVVIARVRDGDDVICVEQFNGIRVLRGVMNLQIGAAMNCDLQRQIDRRSSLQLQICFGGDAACLKPTALAAVPYAVNATTAAFVQSASRANRAGVTNYAQRFSADRDMLIGRLIRVGYFDGETPKSAQLPDQLIDLYDDSGISAGFSFRDGGFLQWVPVRGSTAAVVAFAAKDNATGGVVPLDALVLHSDETLLSGAMVVDVQNMDAADNPVVGIRVNGGGITVVGHAVFSDRLVVDGRVLR